MKIAFVTHYTRLYGANRSLLALIRALASERVEPFVLAPGRGPLTKRLAALGVAFHTAPFRTWMASARWKAPARLAANLALLPLLSRRVRGRDVDLVHTNSSVTPVGAMIAEVLNLPHVWHVREFGDLDYGLSHDWGKGVFRAGLGRAAARIAVSEAVRRHVLAGTSGPCHVIYNGVVSRDRIERLGREAARAESSTDGPYIFAIVGNLRPAKGQEQAIRALHLLRRRGVEARLLVAGDELRGYEARLRSLCEELSIGDHVDFLGFVEDPYSVYRRADAVLVCSPNEAMGRVTAEGMAAARPVIGYDSAGTAEVVEDERTGVLYDGSVEHLAACMERLSRNPAHGASLGRNGWEKAREEYTNEAYARRVYRVMRGVVDRTTDREER